MDSADADLVFPVLAIGRRGEIFAADDLTALTSPVSWLLPDLKGGELIDSRFRCFALTDVRVIGPALPRWKDWFAQHKIVSLDLEPLADTTFNTLKARLIKQVKARPRAWGEHPNDVGETLRPLAACSTLTELISVLAPPDGVAGLPRQGVGYAPPPPSLGLEPETATGPAMTVNEADLAFPVVGLLPSGEPAAARDFKAFTTVARYGVRIDDLTALEIVDANWRRFRVVRACKAEPLWRRALLHLAGLIVNPNWRVHYELEPMAPGSLETTRQRFIAALDADPWRFTQEFNRADHNRERARLRRCETTQEISAGFGASPFECGYSSPPLSPGEAAALQARKAKAARDNREAAVWLAVLYALLSAAAVTALAFPSPGGVWIAFAVLWAIAAVWRLERSESNWTAIAIWPGAIVCLLIGIIGVAGPPP